MDCIFCAIAKGDVPSQKVFEDEAVLGFKDVNPQAPTHILFIPKEHVASTAALAPTQDGLLGRLLGSAARHAAEAGLAEAGYRLVINTGRDAMQSVPHLHVHLLAGRQMGWPPG